MRCSLRDPIAAAVLAFAVAFGSAGAAAQMTVPNDSVQIMATIAGESAAFWNKDFDAWANHWIQTPYVRVMGWWVGGGVTVHEGWEVISANMKTVMQNSPEPNPTATQVRRDNINLQVRGDLAWVTFDQYGLDTGDERMDMPGLSRETRLLEKRGGQWRIAYAGWLLQGSSKEE